MKLLISGEACYHRVKCCVALCTRGSFLLTLCHEYVCVCECISGCWLSEDMGDLRTQLLLNKLEVEESADVSRVQGSCSLARCVFTAAAQSIYSVSMVLILHNHISADLKSHTCCSAIYLEAGFIASNLSPRELCTSLCFFFASMCVCVCQYLSKIPCVLGLVGVIQVDLNLFSSVSSPSEEEVKVQ